MDENARLRAERDLYAALLALSRADSAATLVREALDVARVACGADRGHIALYAHPDDEAPTWAATTGLTSRDVVRIQRHMSRGVLRRARRAGGAEDLPDAQADPELGARDSVRILAIGPILTRALDRRGRGALYLERTVGRPAFDDHHSYLADLLAEHLSASIERLLGPVRIDPTAAWRALGGFESLIGRSDALAGIMRGVTTLRSARRGPVAIHGPPGSGKTAVARVLHDLVVGPARPFLRVACAGIAPDDPLLSPTSGDDAGPVARARGGTLVLEGIDQLHESIRGTAAALAELEDLQLVVTTRLTPQALDPRLEALVRRRIRVPGLDERPEDVPLLVTAFGRAAAGAKGRPFHGLTAEASALVAATPQVEHVRGLRRTLAEAVRIAIAAGAADGPLRAEHVAQALDRALPRHAVADPLLEPRVYALKDVLADYERRYLLHARAVCEGRARETYTRLGIGKATWYDKVARYELPPWEDDGQA